MLNGLRRKAAVVAGSKLAARAEFDRTVGWALGIRLWSVLSGPVTALLIASRFTETEQDFFYTISGLLGLDALCRLGLFEVLVALTSHASAEANRSTAEGRNARRRLAGLVRFAGKWSLLSGAAFAVGVGSFGAWSLSGTEGATPPSSGWSGPWWVAALCTAGSVAVTPALAALSGCGRIHAVTRTQTLAAIAGTVATWTVMLSSGSLWALAAACAGRLTIEITLLARSRGFLSGLAEGESGAFRWLRDVWPMQWRAAVQSSAAAAAAAGLTLVLFQHRDALGAGEAGRLGMSWSAALALQLGGSAWLGTRAPRLGAFAAAGDRADFDRLFARVFVVSWIVVAAGAAVGTAIVWGLNLWGVSLAERVLPPTAFAALVGGTVGLHLPLSFAAAARAWRAEAFVLQAVGLWGAVALATWTLGPRYGAEGVAWGYCGAVWLVGVPLFLHRWAGWRRRLDVKLSGEPAPSRRN